MNFEELKIKFANEISTEENLKKNWKRIQDKIFKQYDIHLEKTGRGKNVVYYIKEEEYFYANKAFVNEWDGEQCRSLISTDLILTNNELYCLLVILFSPMGVFRGTYNTFLTYAEIKPDQLDSIKQAIAALVQKQYIQIEVDNTTEEGYITLISRRYIEKDCLSVPLDKIRKVIRIAKNNNVRSWIPVFKLWAAVTTLDGEVSTAAQITALTGLTKNQITYYGNMLKDSGVFVSEKIFLADMKQEEVRCIGTKKTIAADWSWSIEEVEEK